MYLVFTTNFIFCVYDSLRQRLLVFHIPCLQGGNAIALPVQSLFSCPVSIAFSICINCNCIHCIPYFLFTRRQHHRLASAIFILSSGIYNSHLRDHQVTVRILTDVPKGRILHKLPVCLQHRLNNSTHCYLCYPMPSFSSVSVFKPSRQNDLWGFNGTSKSIAKNHVMFLDIKSFWYTIHENITFLSSKLEGFVG